MAREPEPSAGDVEIELDGEKVVLRCTLSAAQILTNQPGSLYGPGGVSNLLLQCHLATMALVIRAGLGVGPNALPGLEQQIFRQGLLNVRDQISVFVGAIANGGIKVRTEDDEDEGDDAANPPQGAAAKA